MFDNIDDINEDYDNLHQLVDNQTTDAGYDEVSLGITLQETQDRLLREMIEVRRKNEESHPGCFTPTKVSSRIFWANTDFVEEIEQRDVPLVEDLFAYARAAGINLRITVSSACEGKPEYIASFINDIDYNFINDIDYNRITYLLRNRYNRPVSSRYCKYKNRRNSVFSDRTFFSDENNSSDITNDERVEVMALASNAQWS